MEAPSRGARRRREYQVVVALVAQREAEHLAELVGQGRQAPAVALADDLHRPGGIRQMKAGVRYRLRPVMIVTGAPFREG